MIARVHRTLGGFWRRLREWCALTPSITIVPNSPAAPPVPLERIRPSLDFLAQMGCDVEAILIDAAQPHNQLTLRMTSVPPQRRNRGNR